MKPKIISAIALIVFVMAFTGRGYAASRPDVNKSIAATKAESHMKKVEKGRQGPRTQIGARKNWKPEMRNCAY